MSHLENFNHSEKEKNFDLGGLRLQIQKKYCYYQCFKFPKLSLHHYCFEVFVWYFVRREKVWIESCESVGVGDSTRTWSKRVLELRAEWREKYKQKINKTERWAGLGWAGDTRHTGHNSVLRQECVRGILTITNVGLTAHSRQIVSPALWFTFCPREHHGTRGLVTLHYRRYVDYVKIWRRGQSFMKSLNQQRHNHSKYTNQYLSSNIISVA